MKLFISHSWANKTQAQRLVDELRSFGASPWVDTRDLMPGQPIQEVIDKVIYEHDAILLLWSSDAAASDGVEAEMETATRLGKMVIPLKLDSTPMADDRFSSLKGIKSISFQDFEGGLGRLKMVLLYYMGTRFEMNLEEGFQHMNEFISALEASDYMVRKRNIKETGSEDDKDFWVSKIREVHAKSYERMMELQQIGNELQAFLSVKINELSENLNNRQRCLEILAELRAHRYAGRAGMPQFIEHVEKICASFESHSPDQRIAVYRQQLETQCEESIAFIKKCLGWLLGEMLDQTYSNVRYFYLRSADHLEMLNHPDARRIHPLIDRLADDLLRYIQTPGGIIDNKLYGILGYTDDATLIHSMLIALAHEELIDLEAIQTDWQRINAGAETAWLMLDASLKTRMEEEIAAYYSGLVEVFFPERVQARQWADVQRGHEQIWQAKLEGLRGDLLYGNTSW
ncbi:MAG: toll/interleukin-1 receptor domain-containing protein [Candidatus Kapabacteria bacterium]|nr:toll/interleukin-1 receptor domain-containing protein [Candidatus Kapabacteria bacterium]